METQKKPQARRGRATAYTVRLDAEQRQAFEAIASEMGHDSVGAAIKAQALKSCGASPIAELRIQLASISASLIETRAEAARERQRTGEALSRMRGALDKLTTHNAMLTEKITQLISVL